MSAPDPIEALIQRLPKDEHYVARASIGIARSYGWCDFGYWTAPYPGEPARLADLIAVDGDGRLHFLSELD